MAGYEIAVYDELTYGHISQRGLCRVLCRTISPNLFHFTNCSWEDATLFEAAACTVHGTDKLRPAVGSTVLLLEAGATGLCNGGARVMAASHAGPKMVLARSLNVADDYVDLYREEASQQWPDLAKTHPYGFEVVVKATGAPQMLETAILHCAQGGTVIFYGVYSANGRIEISPSMIFPQELTIVGYVADSLNTTSRTSQALTLLARSFSEMWCLSRVVAYLESHKVGVRGIVRHTHRLEDYGKALDAIRQKKCIKAAIVRD